MPRLRVAVALWCLATLLLTGCATTKKKEGPLFFPPKPDTPRLQTLYRFLSDRDIEAHSRFDDFVLGATPSVRLVHPYGVTYHQGKIYIADPTRHGIVILDLEGRKFHLVVNRGEGAMRRPNGVAVAEDGKIYVADAEREQVLELDSEGSYVGAWGKEGGKFHPTAITVRGDELYVANVTGHYIEVMDRHTGEIVREIGHPRPRGATESPPGYLVAPTNVAVDSEGNVYVSDAMESTVVMFHSDGTFARRFGEPGDRPGQLARPRGVAVDKAGRVWVVDAAFENVQIFNSEGKVLMFFGGAGPRPGQMWLPTGVCVDVPVLDFFKPYIAKGFTAESLVLVSNQYGPPNVTVYAFGHGKEAPPAEAAAGEDGGGDDEGENPAEGAATP